jgi:hypothetical protein
MSTHLLAFNIMGPSLVLPQTDVFPIVLDSLMSIKDYPYLDTKIYIPNLLETTSLFDEIPGLVDCLIFVSIMLIRRSGRGIYEEREIEYMVSLLYDTHTIFEICFVLVDFFLGALGDRIVTKITEILLRACIVTALSVKNNMEIEKKFDNVNITSNIFSTMDPVLTGLFNDVNLQLNLNFFIVAYYKIIMSIEQTTPKDTIDLSKQVQQYEIFFADIIDKMKLLAPNSLDYKNYEKLLGEYITPSRLWFAENFSTNLVSAQMKAWSVGVGVFINTQLCKFKMKFSPYLVSNLTTIAVTFGAVFMVTEMQRKNTQAVVTPSILKNLRMNFVTNWLLVNYFDEFQSLIGSKTDEQQLQVCLDSLLQSTITTLSEIASSTCLDESLVANVMDIIYDLDTTRKCLEIATRDDIKSLHLESVNAHVAKIDLVVATHQNMSDDVKHLIGKMSKTISVLTLKYS